jgi:transcriptional regulator with PAS, ATPase and Fis domain
VSGKTETIGRGSGDAKARSSWALVVALECDALDAPPARRALDKVAAVEIGRADERALRRDGERLLIELLDRAASSQHARLERNGDGWTIIDRGSKNGTLVNGRRVDRASLEDGDVIQCGGTFLVLRHAKRAISDIDGPQATFSPAFERTLSSLEKIASSTVPVLIRGETGAGKEVAAGLVHAASRRRGPLVPVNCGAIPATLIESELFGSKRGAFSGAEDRPGLVRSADGGTLFLDEVAELPAASQAALLRVLQDGEVLPLGAQKRVKVDVRVIAATHQPLEELIEEKRFRLDLFGRLRGHEARVPPLRERLEDLGMLLVGLLRRIEPDGPRRRLSREAGRALFAHGWPLNVRELEQALRNAVAMTSGTSINTEDLQLAATPVPVPVARARAGSSPAPGSGATEAERLVDLLREHAGNLSAVARELATSRTQVQRLMERNGLSLDDFRKPKGSPQ